MTTDAPALASKLDALTALSSETSPARRRALLHEVTELFFAPTPPAPAVMDLFDSALDRMTDALEDELRMELSRRLAPATAAPHRLVARLIGDVNGAIAEPLLQRSSVLSEVQLLQVARTGGQVHLRAVSRRVDLTEGVSDTIVERGDVETVGVLVANPRAPLSRAASEAVVDRALANPALHAAVVGRDALPADLLNEMYFVVEQRLRDRIQARNAVLDPAELDRVLAQSRTRLAAKEGALPADYAEADAYVERLSTAGPIAASTLVGFVRAGQRTRFLAALAREADVDFGVARRTLERQDGDAFVLLCKAAGYGEDLFRTL